MADKQNLEEQLILQAVEMTLSNQLDSENYQRQ